MFFILPVSLQSFNRPILFLSKWSSHATISMPYCIFFYFFPFNLTGWIFVILPLTLLKFNRPILFISKWSPHAANYMPLAYFCTSLIFFEQVNNCYFATHSSMFQPADSFHIQMKPSRCHSYALLLFLYFFRFLVTCWMFVILPLTLRSFNQPIVFVFKWNPHAANSCLITYFVIIYLCFDLLNVSYSASHSSKFQPAGTFHI